MDLQFRNVLVLTLFLYMYNFFSESYLENIAKQFNDDSAFTECREDIAIWEASLEDGIDEDN